MNRDYPFILVRENSSPDGGAQIGCDYCVRIHIAILIEIDAEQVGCSREKQETEEQAAQRFVD
jgi:hypothetical protein